MKERDIDIQENVLLDITDIKSKEIKKLREVLLELIVSQLYYEGYQEIGTNLCNIAKLNIKKCQQSDRLYCLLVSSLQNQRNDILEKDLPPPNGSCEFGDTMQEHFKNKLEVVLVSRNTIGLQVDFEDPDVYYFAGGRHVASQTEPDQEYGPLELWIPSPIPVQIVSSLAEINCENQTTSTTASIVNSPRITGITRTRKPIIHQVTASKVKIPKREAVKVSPTKDTVKKREIGEDGWETVRSRSNRSKWSTSSPSSSSSNTDLVGGNNEETEECAADEEKIQEKEAALDSAIREEELIEEELRQVEQDFIQIESEATVSMESKSTETDAIFSSPCPSPSPLPTENDCFFIDIAEDSHKNEDSKEKSRILALREKLMSPAKPDSAETLRRHQARLAKAERNRERLLEAKYNRYVELSERFQTLNETTKRLVEERSELISRAEERRKRADEKRQQLLLEVKRKAHDEESKAKEIAFINALETQIKRKGVMSSVQAKEIEVGGRLQSREEERKIKLEERSMKLSAVLERQSKIKIAWEAKLAQMQERRRRASERILKEKQKRAQERSELALEKARDREERISALNAAKQAKKEELKKSIQQKQANSARRHEESLEHIRQKAIELSAPRTSEESSIRMCTLCKVVIESEVQELSHLRGRSHLDAVKKLEKEGGRKGGPITTIAQVPRPPPPENFGLKFITDVQMDKIESGVHPDKNRIKLTKKHCKKLLIKLNTSGKEFESKETPPILSGKQWKDQTMNRNKIMKNIREMDRIINLFNSQRGSLQMANQLDRLLTDTRKAAVRSKFIQDSLIGMGLFPVLQKLFESKAHDLPLRIFISGCNLCVGVSFRNLYNSVYVLRSSLIGNILELSSKRWEGLIPDGHRWLCGSPVNQNEPLPTDLLLDACLECVSGILGVVPDPFDGIKSKSQTFLTEADIAAIHSRTLDVIGYIVGSGITDRLSVYCSAVVGPVEGQQSVANQLKDSIDFLTMLIYSLQAAWDSNKKPEPTQLLAALESSEIAGSISMSYSLLLHQGAPIRPRSSPSDESPVPSPPGLLSSSLIRSTLCLINAFAKLDYASLQRTLGSEAVSLQFRHIASQLLWQVVPHTGKDPNYTRLINELLIAIGNFTVGNPSNQRTIQAGQTPTVLQQLCTLPSQYLTDPQLSRYLLPTLIGAAFGSNENQEILKESNISMDLLHGFMKSDFAKMNTICNRLLIPTTIPSP